MTLQEKPDFTKSAEIYAHDSSHDEWNYKGEKGFIAGADHAWYSHVEPLQKENERLLSDFQSNERSVFSLNGRCNELTAERDKLKSENERFAIGFAEWIKMNRWILEMVSYNWQKNYSYKLPDIKTTEELLELYKETIKESKKD